MFPLLIKAHQHNVKFMNIDQIHVSVEKHTDVFTNQNAFKSRSI